MPVTIVHAADLHIDSPLRGLSNYPGAPAEEIRAASRRAVENVVDLAVSRRADLAVIAGDVFDGNWTDFNTGLFFAQQLSRLHDQGIPVVLVHGNHDAESLITNRLRLPPSARALSADKPETVLFDDIGVAVHGQSYAQRVVTDNLAAAYPAPVAGMFNVGLLHTAIDGRERHDTYAPCSLSTLRRRGYEYWALGHVHSREVVCTDPLVVFPGNVQGRHARETGPKGVTLVTVDDGGDAHIDDAECDVVRWAVLPVDISACRGLDDVLQHTLPAIEAAEAAAGGRLVAARVLLSGQSEIAGALLGDEERVAAEVRALAMRFARVWIEQVRIQARSPQPSDESLHLGVDRAGRELSEDLGELEQLVADLAGKLPPELRLGVEPALLSEGWLQERAAEAREILRARLVQRR